MTLEEALEAGGALVHPDWESYEIAVPISGLRKGNVAWETTTTTATSTPPSNART